MELLGIQQPRFPYRSTQPHVPGWAYLALVAFAALLFGCTGTDHPPQDGTAAHAQPTITGVCTPGHAGCPCSSPGTTVACGSIVGQYGDYVTCQMGQSTCTGSVWGACLGDRQILTKTAATLSDPSGIHVLSQTSSACGGNDVCDPGCFWTTSTAADVDASGIAAAPALDGGSGPAITLVSTECSGLQCQIPADCPAGSPTQLTGVVTDPAGVNPISNAVVYIPIDSTGALNPFSTVVSCDSCASAGAVEAVALANTAPDGTFTLTNVPSTEVAPGAAIPLVVQVGKWRREEILTAVPRCVSTPVPPALSRLPRNRTDGNNNQADLPKIAIATGFEDAPECLLLKMGVDLNEFQVALDGGVGPNRVDLYQGNGPGYFNETTPPEQQLESSPATLAKYDAVLLPCEGVDSELDNTRLGYASNIAAYADTGGKVFATHQSISWLAMTSTPGNANATNPSSHLPNPFYGAVNWAVSNGAPFSTAIQASIDTALPGGQAFAAWMADVDAGSPVTINQAGVDVTSVIPPTTEWMRTANSPSGTNGPISFSFDTPLAGTTGADGGVVTADGGAGSCGRVMFDDFHVAASDRVSPGNPCIRNSDCGYTATCSPPPNNGACMPEACASDSDCSAGFTCGPLGQNTCLPTATPCNVGTDCRSGSCVAHACTLSPYSCATNADCGPVETCGTGGVSTCGRDCHVDSDCVSGGECINDRCVGCFLNMDCASGLCEGQETSPICSVASQDFPLSCKQGQPLTPQEDALEFMLFDLTSCVAPAPFAGQPAHYEPATFTETFTASMYCQGPGETPIWREFDWNATIPGDSSITFQVQTGDPGPDGGAVIWNPSTPLLLAKATTSTVGLTTAVDAGTDADADAAPSVSQTPGYDVALMDTGFSPDGGTSRLFMSQSELLLTVTLTPSSDGTEAPTLNQWRITSVCSDSE